MSKPSEAELRAKAEELRLFAEETRAKFEAVRLEAEGHERRNRFFMRDRRNYWRMPAYVWVPIVSALVILFLFAMYNF